MELFLVNYLKVCLGFVIKVLIRSALVFVMLVFLNACGDRPTAATSAWRIGYQISDVTPQQQIALWISENQPLLAWVGDPATPNLRLLQNLNTLQTLPLGITPRQLTAYPLPHGWTQFLWLDQTLPDELQLIGGTVDEKGEVQRGPTEISLTRTLDYAAASIPSGAVLTLWTTLDHQTKTPAVYAQIIDALGRPLPARRVAQHGQFPALAVDQRGTIHLFWMDTADGLSWTLHYSSLTVEQAAGSGDLDLGSQVVGAIALKEGEMLYNVQLGADASRVYACWTIQDIANTASSRIEGISFPLNSPTSVQPFTLTIPDQQLANISFASSAGNELYATATATARDGTRSLIAATIMADGIGAAQNINSASPPLGKASLTADLSGHLHVAWLSMQSDGRATLFYATNKALEGK